MAKPSRPALPRAIDQDQPYGVTQTIGTPPPSGPPEAASAIIVSIERQLTSAHEPRTALVEGSLPALDVQHAWYKATQHDEWSTLALVPVSANVETLGLAHGFGRMAAREPHDGVWVVNASSKVANTEPLNGNREEPEAGVIPIRHPYDYFDLANLEVTPQAMSYSAQQLMERFVDAERSNPHKRFRAIFAVDSPLMHTDTISLLRAVDGVVLCVSLGTTLLDDARRVIDIVGKDKVVGCIAITPKAP